MSDLHVGMPVDGDCANHPDPTLAISPHDGDKPGRTAGAASSLSRGCRVPLVRAFGGLLD